MGKSSTAVTILLTMIVAICFYAISGCGSCKRTMKTIDSDIRAGVERTAVLYDYNGQPIKKWEGKIDMSSSQVETYLLVGEKRVIIHGGIMVVEEK